MNTLAIVKPQVVVIPPWIEELAEKTKKLGYNALNIRVQQAVGFYHGVALLNQIGVDVFAPKSVDRYKKIALMKISFRSMWGWVLVSAMLAGVTLLSWGHQFTPADGWVLLFCLSAIGVIAAMLRGAWVFGETHRHFHWERSRLADYRSPVPAFALQTAVKISERIPATTLFIEELERKKVVDPFLVVEIGNNRYHVAVWNEPSFKEYFV